MATDELDLIINQLLFYVPRDFLGGNRREKAKAKLEQLIADKVREGRVDELDEVSELFYQAYLEDEDVHNELNQRIIGKRLASLTNKQEKGKGI